MRPRTQLFHSVRASALRPTAKATREQIPLCLRFAPRRYITAEEKPLSKAEKKSAGPNQDQLPHVSEEAAAIGKVTGEGGPELEHGTPVQEVLKRDEGAKEKAPKVMQEEAKSSPSGTRSFSTSARRQAEALVKRRAADIQQQGHIYGLPELPMPRTSNLRHRYEPIVDQVTKLLMRDGKLSVAQRNMALILERLRTAPPPKSNPQRPLLPGAPPTSHLPLDPILYLTLAIDSVAPLMRIRSQRGAAGGGMALQIPVPLGLRQRRRRAVLWILDVANKKRTNGSGRSMFSNKVADELIAIIEGRSRVWEKRGEVHRMGVSARANLSLANRRRR